MNLFLTPEEVAILKSALEGEEIEKKKFSKVKEKLEKHHAQEEKRSKKLEERNIMNSFISLNGRWN
jgi:F0F1-type ATP synthase epsilon subunit